MAGQSHDIHLFMSASCSSSCSCCIRLLSSVELLLSCSSETIPPLFVFMVVAAAVPAVVVGSSWVGAPSFGDGVVGASGAPTADDGDADVPPVASRACSRGASCGGDP